METLAPSAPVQRDAAASFIDSIQNPKIAKIIKELGHHPYRLDLLFPKTTGWGVAGQIKKRIALLRHLQPLLPTLLYPDEEIHFVTKGTLNSWIEQYFLGLVAVLINRTVFVVTNYRVILLNSDGKGRPRQMKWQIPYDEVKQFKAGGFSGLIFKLRNGKKYKFSGVPSADCKLLKAYMSERMGEAQAVGPQFPHYQSRDPLCPACCTPAPVKARQCRECGDLFVNPNKPALLSLALPCLGELYLGHRWLVVFEMVGYLVLWLIWINMLIEEGLAALPFVLVVVVAQHALDAGLTYHMANKGLTSQSQAWKNA